MKKKLIAISLVAMLGLSGCGLTGTSSSSSEASVAEETTAEEATTEAATEEETTEAATEAPTEAETEEETTEAATEEETKEDSDKDSADKGSASAKPVEGLSDKYVDFDNRSFAYNGKVFTVGESTFQDLIDGGVAFKEDDLNNINNNVNKNHSTSTYTVKISDYSSIQFEFINCTDDSMQEKDCVLSSARWYTIYVPQFADDQKRNDDIIADLEKAAEVVSFSFPLTLKKDDLLAQAPDYTDYSEGMEQYSYQVDSTKYFGGSGYKFEFNKDIGQLEEVYITWLP